MRGREKGERERQRERRVRAKNALEKEIKGIMREGE